MLWLAVGLVVLGAACGAAFRVALLIAVLAAAASIVAASDVWRGSSDLFVDAVIAIVAPQIGYVLGVCVRAVIYTRARRREGALGRAQYPMPDSPRDRH